MADGNWRMANSRVVAGEAKRDLTTRGFEAQELLQVEVGSLSIHALAAVCSLTAHNLIEVRSLSVHSPSPVRRSQGRYREVRAGRRRGGPLRFGSSSVSYPFHIGYTSVPHRLHVRGGPDRSWVRLAACWASPLRDQAIGFPGAALPTVDLHDRADKHSLAGLGHAILLDVGRGDIALPVARGRQGAQHPVVPAALCAPVLGCRPIDFDRDGGGFRDVQPEDDAVAAIGDMELPDGVRARVRRGRRVGNECLAEGGPGSIDFEEECPRGQATRLTRPRTAALPFGSNLPGPVSFFAEAVPQSRYSPPIALRAIGVSSAALVAALLAGRALAHVLAEAVRAGDNVAAGAGLQSGACLHRWG